MTTPYQPNRVYQPTRSPVTSAMPLAPSRPRLVAQVFEDRRFRGRWGIVLSNVPDTRRIGFQDNISSVKVYRGPGYASNPNSRMILHEHFNYEGRQVVLDPGYYPDLHDIAYNFGDRVSSISFGSALVTTGPDFGTIPLIVEVYQHPNFRGRKITVVRDIASTESIGLHDAISSIRVFRGPNFPPTGCKVIFYEHDYSGQSLEINLGPLEYHKEIPNLHTQPRFFGDIISSIKIESRMVSGTSRFKEIVFLDEFNALDPVWQWIDPRGDCRRELGRPVEDGVLRERAGWLELHVGPNHDLWWGDDGRGGNMDAPRMLQEISGDFALEIHVTSTERGKEHGGILVWKNQNRFVRLDKTSILHAFGGDVRFEAHIGRRYIAVGRGQMGRSMTNYLRLERIGHEFQAYCSTDGQNWQSCGNDMVVMRDPVMVGMHALCPGNIPGTMTRIDYFKIMRPVATTTLGLTSPVPQPTTTQPPRR